MHYIATMIAVYVPHSYKTSSPKPEAAYTHHALIIDKLTNAYRFSREKQYEFIQELTIASTHKRWLSHSYIYQLFCYLQDIRARTGLKNDHPVIFALTHLSSVWHYIVCYISKFEWSYKNTYTLQTVEDRLGMSLTFNVNNHEIQQSHACPAHQYAQAFSTRPSASATIITPHAYVMHTASHIPNLVSAPASNEALSQTLPAQSSSPDSNRTPANPATHSNHQPLPSYNAVSFSIFGRNTVLFLDTASIWRGVQASASHAAQASASNSQQLNHHAKASKKRLPPPQPSPPSHKGFRTNPYADYDITKHLNFWQPSQDVDINTQPFAQR